MVYTLYFLLEKSKIEKFTRNAKSGYCLDDMGLANILFFMASCYERLYRQDGNYIAYTRHCPDQSEVKNNCELLFCNGFMSDMTGNKANFLRDFGVEEHFTITTFDYFGHGLSSGDFNRGTISIWLDNLLTVIDEVTSGPLILIGSSMGGWLMTLAALQRPIRVKALLGIAIAPDFTEELIWKKMLSEESRNQLINEGTIDIPSEYAEHGFISISRELIEDGRKHTLLDNPISIDIPIHLVHGTEDQEIPWKTSYNYLENVRSQDITLSLIKGGDHRLSSPNNLSHISKIIKELQTKLDRH